MTAAEQRKENPSAVYINPDEPAGSLSCLGGSKSDAWNNLIANQAFNALWLKNSSADDRDKQLNATVAALMGIAPRDEMEGMLAAQLIAAHNAAIECYRRAMIGEQTFEGRKENLSQANKLSRTYATVLEALNRHRGKGQQKVTVEHVHVHSGGQAIVGSVETQGGGRQSETREQPHAKQIAHASQSTLPCADARGEAVPVTGDVQQTLPNAPRQSSRRGKGQ